MKKLRIKNYDIGSKKWKVKSEKALNRSILELK